MKQKNCRYCNRLLAPKDVSCPACGKRQHYIPELLALLLFVLCFTVMYFQISDALFDANNPEPPPPSVRKQPAPPRSTVAQTRPPYTVNTQRRTTGLQSASRPQPPSQKPTAEARQPATYQDTLFQVLPGDYPFYVAERRWDPKAQRYVFYRRGMHGTERSNPYDNRFNILSENQSDYPVPQSGCGPIALLNLFIWYKNNGLIEESIRYSDPHRYKQHTFQRIDRKIEEIRGYARTPAKGANILEMIVAIDELVQEHSRSPLRIHFDIKRPPLNTHDFLNLARNHRFGILIGRPRKQGSTRLQGYHAVLVVRGDLAGTITIANWGIFQHGLLVNRPDGQWFVPDNESQYEMLITSLITLIPFTPSETP